MHVSKVVQGKKLKHNHQIAEFAPRQVQTLVLYSEHSFFYHYVGRKYRSYSLIILFWAQLFKANDIVS